MTVTLIGRDAELQDLSEAIADPACSAVILRGPAGAGKTVLARAALEAAEYGGALVGAGKFAQGEVQAPFAPLMSALSGTVARAFDRLHEPEPVAEAMSRELGPALGVLVQTGLRLDGAPWGSEEGEFDVRPMVGRREGEARIVDAALRLVRWLAPFEAPVVILLDDWRRGGARIETFAAALIKEVRDPALTLILTERDDVAPSPLAADGRLRTLHIGPLAAAARRRLVEGVLGEAGGAVCDWLGSDAPVLPFDLLATAEALGAAGAVRHEDGEWRVDPLKAAALGRGDLARGLAGRLAMASPDGRDLALAAALWGDAASAALLRRALGFTPAAFEAGLAEALRFGVVRAEGGEVRFPHDRLREAVLETGATRTATLADGMAERLIRAASDPGGWKEIARATLRFRQLGGVAGVDAASWRDRFAEGARAARTSSDIETASGFAESAWSLREPHIRPGDDGQRLVAREAVLAAADRKDVTQVRARLAALFAVDGQAGANAPSLGEDYELAIAAFRLAGDPASAWEAASEGLGRFGIALPPSVSTPRLLAAAALWRLDRALRPLRGVTQARPAGVVGAFTRIANAAAMLAYERSPRLSALLALEGSRRAGRAAQTLPFWMSADTFLLATLGDWAGAARLGEQAAAAVGAAGLGGFAHAATLNRALGWGCAWRRPAAELRFRADEVRDLAMAEGDLVQAAGAIRNGALSGWRSAPSLTILREEVRAARAEAQRLGDADVAVSIAVILAAIDHLTGGGPPSSPTIVPGDPPAWVSEIPASGVVVTLELASVHGDWTFGRAFAEARRAFRRELDSNPRTVDWRFHESLARLKTGAAARRADLSVLRRAAKLNPRDHRAKLLVVEAASLSRRGRGATGTEWKAAWARAVAAAEGGSSPLVAGVAAEAAAEAARSRGDHPLADHYTASAQAIWRAWGARIKRVDAQWDSSTEGSSEHHEAAAGRDLAQARIQAMTAERTAQARSRFLADVAHELRTPLQSLQGLLDLAADDPAQLDLSSLRQVFSSLRTVVDDLTDFGALGSGEAPVATRPVAIAQLVRSECSVSAAFAAEQKVHIVVTEDGPIPPWIATDGPRVRQVVRNLLSNAAKYAGGGRVEVTLRASRAELHSPTVADEGSGLDLWPTFPAGLLGGLSAGPAPGTVWAWGWPWLRLDGTPRLGGAPQAGRHRPGGSLVTLRLPLVPAEPPDQGTPVAVRPLRILLAEDAELVRRLFATILSRQGHAVSQAANGAAAAALLERERFDLAILDLSMPVLTGPRWFSTLMDGQSGARRLELLPPRAATSRPVVRFLARLARPRPPGSLLRPTTWPARWRSWWGVGPGRVVRPPNRRSAWARRGIPCGVRRGSVPLALASNELLDAP